MSVIGLVGDESKRLSRALQAFYQKQGPCCAGCDHWDPLNSCAGECTRTAPVSGDQVLSMIYDNCSASVSAGHIVTPREHVCGEFVETENWL